MRKTKLFIDTGAWIALIVSKDQYHQAAAEYYRHLNPATQRISSSHVISETYTWLRYKSGFAYASRFIATIRQASANDSLTVVQDDIDLIERAEQLLFHYPDQKLSYTDALSMAIIEREKITQVFGFDHHFQLMQCEVFP